MNPLLAIALISALIVGFIVPAKVWKGLFLLGTVIIVAQVGWFAFVLWLGEIQ